MGGSITISGVEVAPGERQRIEIPVAEPYGLARLTLPVVVLNGQRPGPRLFASAAIHGDEIIGVEILRRIRHMALMRRLRGTLITVPIVNVYGFLNQTRYLPDRRDLNRSFPGSSQGSLAARLAHVFMKEIVARSTHGIDLHSASQHRVNLPQIRACLSDPETDRLARAFGVPVILDANLRDGSLRQAVLELGIPMLLYEAGQALRFDELAVRAGVRGLLSVMRALDMLPPSRQRRSHVEPVEARSSHWARAPVSGILRSTTALGARVKANSRLGIISDPVGDRETRVTTRRAGIVIGRTDLPLVNEGDALFHVATFDDSRAVSAGLETLHAELDPETEPAPSGEPPLR